MPLSVQNPAVKLVFEPTVMSRSEVVGARLQGHLNGDAKAPPHEITIKPDGKDDKESLVPNPTCEAWEATDQ